MEFSVLIVDDQPENIKTISSLLRQMHLGKKIYSAPNGLIGLELAKKYQPDLIISDWEMPEMNGIELVKSVKKNENLKDIPFIIVTAVKIEDNNLLESFEAGVHDYLRKPFSNIEFFARIKATLNYRQEFLENKESKKEVVSQANLLKIKNDELIKLNDLKDKFLSIISHDTKAPLLDLDSIITILLQDNFAFDQNQLNKYFTQTHLKLKNLIAFLNNMLFWSKSQIEKEQITFKKVNVFRIINEIKELFQLRIDNKKIVFKNSINQDLEIETDPDIISFILRNLIDNAIKFTPLYKTIRIQSKIEGNFVAIQVIDEGVGMEPKMVKTLFSDQLMNSHLGTSGEIGTGLGLKLCIGFANQLDSELTVNSSPGKGTTFKLKLPFR